MLNLINILTLSTALTLQPLTEKITITTNEEQSQITVSSNLQKESQYSRAFILTTKNSTSDQIYKFATYNTNLITTIDKKNTYYLGFNETTDITKYKNYNEYEKTTYNDNYYYINIPINLTVSNNIVEINIRSKTSMEELLTALTTAVQSAVSIFVEGFGGLTQIFYNGTEITFIGGVLVVGLAVMFLMMFLRWIVSFVRGI